jgi:hypothetical protein
VLNCIPWSEVYIGNVYCFIMRFSKVLDRKKLKEALVKDSFKGAIRILRREKDA